MHIFLYATVRCVILVNNIYCKAQSCRKTSKKATFSACFTVILIYAMRAIRSRRLRTLRSVAAFAATQAVYWLNLDNKVIFLLYKLLHKRYDALDPKRDRRFWYFNHNQSEAAWSGSAFFCKKSPLIPFLSHIFLLFKQVCIANLKNYGKIEIETRNISLSVRITKPLLHFLPP